MFDDVSDIAAFYNGNPETERRRLDRNQLEFDLTWRYLDQYLPSQGTILEIGAATGRYTVELARRGYAVTAVDLSAGLLEVCRRNIAEAGFEERVQFVVADARDLKEVTRTDFDAALLMGPLYHLIIKADRKAALREVYDRLRDNGVIFSAYISRFGVLSHLLKNNPGWIGDQPEVRSVLANGRRPDDAPRGGFRGYLTTVAEIAPLHEAVGFDTSLVAGVEPAIGADDESYNQLEGEQRQRWLDLLYTVSTEPSILGASRHLLYVGHRRSG